MTRLDFVKAWLELRDTRAIAERLGLDTHKVANLAAQLRGRGVDLPKLPIGRPPAKYSPTFSDPLNVAALNKFIHAN
jgi:hypothetical protein